MSASAPSSATKTSLNWEDDTEKRLALKTQKKEYRDEKKRAAKELGTALNDPTVVVMGDWLKVRGTFRKWMRFFCVVKPGILLVYKSAKTNKYGYWVGTVLLNTCQLIERPSKKDGFCFKLYHPLDQSIWATKGPRGETLGAVTFQPVPSSYLICRAASEELGRCWLDALELSLRCSSLLMRSMNKMQQDRGQFTMSASQSVGSYGSICDTPEITKTDTKDQDASSLDEEDLTKMQTDVTDTDVQRQVTRKDMSESEAEKHFSGFDDEDTFSETEDALRTRSLSSTKGIGMAGTKDAKIKDQDLDTTQTVYVESPPEQMGSLGDAEQTEEIGDENKSLLWTLLKQIRPGMDLSRVVLPTFILERRSFLEKLADFYYHSDILAETVQEEDSYNRMVGVVKFYLSGFYKKPQGLKKPYNPILGEAFRCYWINPDGSKTFYIAEQVSHHPPISSLFVTNRQSGYNINGTILAKSKFYGNSLSAMMNGTGRISLLSRGETYSVTLPYAFCKGLIIGTLTMELGGRVSITCDRTSYNCELEFKLKPFLGGSMNVVQGKIKLGKETLADIEGFWDGEISLTERATGKKSQLWKPTSDVVKRRLKRFEVPFEQLGDFESAKLWTKVTEAILNEDQVKATEEKTKLEDAQRLRAKALKASNELHVPNLFEWDANTDDYQYIHADYRPWDKHNDLRIIECDFVIRTIAKHQTVPIRVNSIDGVQMLGPDQQERLLSDESSDTESIRKRNKRRSRASPQPLANMKALIDECLKPNHNALLAAENRLKQMQVCLDEMLRRHRAGSRQQSVWEQYGILLLFALIQAIVFALVLKR